LSQSSEGVVTSLEFGWREYIRGGGKRYWNCLCRRNRRARSAHGPCIGRGLLLHCTCASSRHDPPLRRLGMLWASSPCSQPESRTLPSARFDHCTSFL